MEAGIGLGIGLPLSVASGFSLFFLHRERQRNQVDSGKYYVSVAYEDGRPRMKALDC